VGHLLGVCVRGYLEDIRRLLGGCMGGYLEVNGRMQGVVGRVCERISGGY